jgi:hypothetical protein
MKRKFQPTWNAIGVDPRNVWTAPSESQGKDVRPVTNSSLRDVDANLQYPDDDVRMNDGAGARSVDYLSNAYQDFEELSVAEQCDDQLGYDSFVPHVTEPRAASPVSTESEFPWRTLNTRPRPKRAPRPARHDSEIDSDSDSDDSDDDYMDSDFDYPPTPVSGAPLPIRRGRGRAPSSAKSAPQNITTRISNRVTPVRKASPERKANEISKREFRKRIEISLLSEKIRGTANQNDDLPSKAIPVPRPAPTRRTPPTRRTTPAPKAFSSKAVRSSSSNATAASSSQATASSSSNASSSSYFPCTFAGCPQVCKSVGDLRRHMEAIRHKAPSCECLPCGMRYTRLDALRRHWNRPGGRGCRSGQIRRVENGEFGYLPLSCASHVSK